MELSVILHQVCSSDFLETTWIDSIYGDGNWLNTPVNEFRSRGVVYFLVLKSLCGMAERSTTYIIWNLLNRNIFKGKAISEDELSSNINHQVNETREWNLIDLYSLIEMGRGAIHASQLMTVLSSNWVYSSVYNSSWPGTHIPTKPVSHASDCFCSFSSSCTKPVYMIGQLVPGFVLGCYPVESLLRSTIICLYNHTCIQHINVANLSTIQTLNSSLPSRFMPNAIVDEIAKNGFIERWSLKISYSKFFSQCAPSYCTYTISQRKTALQFVALLLGIYSGLTLILRIIAPSFISLLLSIRFLGRGGTAGNCQKALESAGKWKQYSS